MDAGQELGVQEQGGAGPPGEEVAVAVVVDPPQAGALGGGAAHVAVLHHEAWGEPEGGKVFFSSEQLSFQSIGPLGRCFL